MTTYGKIENGQFIPAPNAEVNFLNSNGYSPFDEELVSKHFAGMAIVQGDELTDITNTDDYKAKTAAIKEKEFFNNFIETSIGWLRKTPKGYSSIVEAMNSALNVIYINGSLPEGVWTLYPKPDFAKVDDIEKYLEENSFKNKEMKSEEFGKIYVEFMNKWNSQEHAS